MTIMELGAMGEFVGAIAVVVTLGPIIVKLTGVGYPEDLSSLDTLSETERGRLRQWQIAQHTHWDNMYYQYQPGFLDEIERIMADDSLGSLRKDPAERVSGSTAG